MDYYLDQRVHLTSGGKLWHFKYRFGGKEKKLTFGTYPSIFLSEARQHREEARKLLANGSDPGKAKKAQKEEQAADLRTFENVAREWFAKNKPVWSKSRGFTVMGRLVTGYFPGDRKHFHWQSKAGRYYCHAEGHRGAG